MNITETGFYFVPEAEYHADPCRFPSLSSSLISTILTGTMAAARAAHPKLNPAYEAEDVTQFDLGKVSHTLMLGEGDSIFVIDADDWRTKAAKEARADAIARGLQPVLLSVYEQAEIMVANTRAHLDRDEDNSRAFRQGCGIAEQVAIAALPTAYGDIQCRARIDWRDNEKPIIWDYKTNRQGADPHDFSRYLFGQNRDVQDPFYALIVAQILGCEPQEVEFRYVVQSANEPFEAVVIQLDDQAREFAFERASWAMNRWAQSIAEDQWPAYRPRTHYITPPNYAMHQWADKISAELLADDLDRRDAALRVMENDQ
jgi:hypothetical protein